MPGTPLEVVQEFMAAMVDLDYDRALTFVADDVVYENMMMGPVEGPAGIRAVLEPFFAPVLENEWIIRNTAVNGDVVFMERLDRHRLPNGWAELPVTGVFEIRDGHIAAWREYFDFATIERGLAEHG